MNKIQIVALAALLTGCASAPQPQVDTDNSYQAVEQTLERPDEVAEQPELSPRTTKTSAPARAAKFQPPPRKPVDAQDQHFLGPRQGANHKNLAVLASWRQNLQLRVAGLWMDK